MAKRQEIRERRLKQKRQKRTSRIIMVSGVALIIAAFLILPSIRNAVIPLGEFVSPERETRPMVDANTMGDPNAPVVIEEFSDFGCGHCKNFSEGPGKQIVENYVSTGLVYFIYRSSGGIINNQTSPIAAEAAYCAGDQNMFWEYHDIMFANQTLMYGNPNADIERYLKAFAESLELDMDEFNSCFDGNDFREQVSQDEFDARRAGISSTPSFLINGTLIVGNQPFSTFEETIEVHLSSSQNQ